MISNILYAIGDVIVVIIVLWAVVSMARRKGYHPVYWAISTIIFAPMLLILWCLPKKNLFFELPEATFTEKIIEALGIIISFGPILVIIYLFHSIVTYKPS